MCRLHGCSPVQRGLYIASGPYTLPSSLGLALIGTVLNEAVKAAVKFNDVFGHCSSRGTQECAAVAAVPTASSPVRCRCRCCGSRAPGNQGRRRAAMLHRWMTFCGEMDDLLWGKSSWQAVGLAWHSGNIVGAWIGARLASGEFRRPGRPENFQKFDRDQGRDTLGRRVRLRFKTVPPLHLASSLERHGSTNVSSHLLFIAAARKIARGWPGTAADPDHRRAASGGGPLLSEPEVVSSCSTNLEAAKCQ